MARTLAIGDIHGCSMAFHTLLETVRPQPDDTVIILGDCVDRGPDTKWVVNRLLVLERQCRLILIKGNHEIMMLNSRTDPECEKEWRGHGGRETLKSYAPKSRQPTLHDIPAAHWDFIESRCLDYWETETHFFVHANAAPDVPLAEQAPLNLFWAFLTGIPAPHISGKIMVCGHTSQESGYPFQLRHLICLDTWAHGGGWLSCLDLDTNTVTQTNQQGDIREIPLLRWK